MSSKIFHGEINLDSIDFIKKTIQIKQFYHNPKYAQIVSSFEKNSIPYYFLIKDTTNSDFVYYQFIKREISTKICGITYFDIMAPFDYGEYYNNNIDLLDSFFNEFNLFCNEKHIISQFIRFNPMTVQNIQIYKKYIDITYIQDHIYINLTQDYFKCMSRSKKSDIKKGLEPGFSFSEDSIENFYIPYQETMRRIKASEYFLFDILVLKELITNNFAKVFSIKYLDETVMSAIILEGNNCCYYFLSGTKDNYHKFRLNSKLLNFIAQFYKDKNKALFLAGGQGTLYKFKEEMSKDKVPYYIGKKIYNHTIYDKLTSITNNKNNSFFPKYRKKII